MEVKFVKPTDELLQHIADDMRPADTAEILASHDHTPIEALVNGWSESVRSAVVTINDEPCVMLGLSIRDILSGVGHPWLLGTNGSLRYKRVFIDNAVPVLGMMLDICPTLFNYVHCENKTSIRWLKRIGFVFDDPEPYGVAGELFHRFEMKKV